MPENTPTHDPIRNATVPELEAFIRARGPEAEAALARLDGLANSPATSSSTRVLAGNTLEALYADRVIGDVPTKSASVEAARLEAFIRAEYADLDAAEAAARDLEELERITDEAAAGGVYEAAEDARDEPAEAATTLTGEARTDELLIANGYAALRSAALSPAAAAAGLHPQHVDACITYCERARKRLQAAADPRAREALDGLEADLETFRAVRHFLKALNKLAERQQARDAILAR